MPTRNTAWSPYNWKTKPIVQDVVYDDQEHLDRVLKKISDLPPMVSAKEIETLRDQLKDAALGKTFLLQGGDCAELFDYCSKDPIENKLKVLLQMSSVLNWGAKIPIVRIARMAGQYGKPRSNPMEMHEGKLVHSYRGDNVNGFDPTDRTPNPERLLGAYFHSATTLNYVRTTLGSGSQVFNEWNLDHIKSNSVKQEYDSLLKRVSNSTMLNNPNNVYVSHEALLLDYEAALTRLLPWCSEKKWYNAGAHFLWIGDRTRQPNGAHVEYMKGIENPIGIKVGPSTVPEELVELLNTLNPKREIGKVTLITRFGIDKVAELLPPLIYAVKNAGHIPVWICDPMHGNTKTSQGNLKTRDFADIMEELSQTFYVHKQCLSKLNGVHFELTGETVTECIGGSMDIKDSDLSSNYKTFCDPRLNYEQSIDAAITIAQYFQNERKQNKRLFFF